MPPYWTPYVENVYERCMADCNIWELKYTEWHASKDFNTHAIFTILQWIQLVRANSSIYYILLKHTHRYIYIYIYHSYSVYLYIYILLYIMCVRPMYSWAFRFRNWVSGAIPEPFWAPLVTYRRRHRNSWRFGEVLTDDWGLCSVSICYPLVNIHKSLENHFF